MSINEAEYKKLKKLLYWRRKRESTLSWAYRYLPYKFYRWLNNPTSLYFELYRFPKLLKNYEKNIRHVRYI